ncbi:MAG: bifunctional methylenetetrahydrofolate dehydrogenase/methenyltetrahydrofolate cyclohydrolase FolD [Candidatus Kerfeldbacteria bacterium]|nr:bifunctional methylenetetrahydrofolate dehydrogenase/methenyltetrahydrofolate cyclohydrolase FolD [Candidatus Kerfeldbacteria bacterium]
MSEEHLTKILSGTGLAAQIRRELKEAIEESKVQPGLAVVLVGQDPASRIYVKFKTQASEEVGIYLETVELPEDISQKKLLKVIARLNKSKDIHGILVQLPLPRHLDTYEVIEAIDPAKDVDGFHSENVGWLSIGEPRLMPATTKGIMTLLEANDIELAGKHVVMVGASNIVGKPTAMALLNKNATVTICHKLTEDLKAHTKHADILITATGVPKLITPDMVKEGVVIVDAGITRYEGKVVGDVDFEAVMDKASYITPVPGGVGPMTVVSLLQNTLEAMRAIEGLD